MALVNHNKDSQSQQRVLALAAGRHVVGGHLYMSYSVGASPNHQVFLRQLLGETMGGGWEGVESVNYEASGGTIVIAEADYIFHNGTQTASGAWFPTDAPHTGTVMIDIRLPVGFEYADTDANAPGGARVICKCERFPNFDGVGNQIDASGAIAVTNAALLSGAPMDYSKFFYTANAARQIAGWSLHYAKIDADRFNWQKFTAFRDFHAASETNDYTTLGDIEGFGLSAKYYNGTNFETEAVSRLDKSVFFSLSAGSPAKGVGVDNFSARWQGFIKAKFSETFTFTLAHTQGGRLIVGGAALIDQFTAAGTQTATLAMVAGRYYPITVEWTHTTGSAEIVLKWQAASVPVEIIKPANLFPNTTSGARYESHVDFSSPTSLDQMIDWILLNTNSIRQDIEGKIELYAVEQLLAAAPVFHFDTTLPPTEQSVVDGKIEFGRSSVTLNQRQNIFEADARNLDSEYLEKPEHAPRLVASGLLAIAGREIYGAQVALANMTVWQMYKVLARIMGLAVVNDLLPKFDATKKAFRVVAGDLVLFTYNGGDFAAKRFQVAQSIDYSPEESSGRKITLKEI